MKHIHTFESFVNEAKKPSNAITLKKFLSKDHNNLWNWMQKEFGLKYSPGLQRVAGPLTHGGDFTIDVSNWDEKDIEALKAYLKSQNHVFESFLNEGRVKATDKIIIPTLSDIDHTRIVKWCSANGIKDCEWEKSGDGYIMDTSKMPISDQQDLDKYLFASRIEYTREFTK